MPSFCAAAITYFSSISMVMLATAAI